MAQEQVEEYLEAIYDIAGTEGSAKTTAIAKCLKVAPASVTEALQSLAEKNLVNYEPYRGASLTGEGKKIAETIKRRHRLLEVFLADVLHINRAKVHDEACRMEHSISEDTENALCRMLNAPARCPHGSPIAPCAKGIGSAANVSSKPVRLSLIQRNCGPDPLSRLPILLHSRTGLSRLSGETARSSSGFLISGLPSGRRYRLHAGRL